MNTRKNILRQFSFTSTSKRNLFQEQAPGISYEQFCNHMNVIAGYKTIVISERAYNLGPFGRIAGKTEDGDYILEIGNTSKSEADRSAKIVNGNMQHMDKYHYELSMEAANPKRGYK